MDALGTHTSTTQGHSTFFSQNLWNFSVTLSFPPLPPDSLLRGDPSQRTLLCSRSLCGQSFAFLENRTRRRLGTSRVQGPHQSYHARSRHRRELRAGVGENAVCDMHKHCVALNGRPSGLHQLASAPLSLHRKIASQCLPLPPPYSGARRGGVRLHLAQRSGFGLRRQWCMGA